MEIKFDHFKKYSLAVALVWQNADLKPVKPTLYVVSFEGDKLGYEHLKIGTNSFIVLEVKRLSEKIQNDSEAIYCEEQMVKSLSTRYPEIKVVGYHGGY